MLNDLSTFIVRATPTRRGHSGLSAALRSKQPLVSAAPLRSNVMIRETNSPTNGPVSQRDVNNNITLTTVKDGLFLGDSFDGFTLHFDDAINSESRFARAFVYFTVTVPAWLLP